MEENPLQGTNQCVVAPPHIPPDRGTVCKFFAASSDLKESTVSEEPRTEPGLPRTIILPSDLVHLTENNRHALIRKVGGQWATISDEAYKLVMDSQGKTVEDAVALGAQAYGAKPGSIRALFKVLFEKNVLISGPEGEAPTDPVLIRPTSVTFWITNRCNLSCIMCCADAVPVHAAHYDEMSTAEVVDCLDKLAGAGCRDLFILGGEPLIRGDLFEILEHARSPFKRVRVATNATLLSREHAERFARLVDGVQVPLEGSTAEIHDVTRGAGAFDAAMMGICHLVDAGVPVTVSQILTKLNTGDEQGMRDLVTSLGVSHRFGRYSYAGRGGAASELLCADDGTVLRTESDCAGTACEKADNPAINMPECARTLARERCGAITASISVSHDGTAYPCGAMHTADFAIGNVNNVASMAELLCHGNQVVDTVLSRTADAVAGCRECSVRYFCGGVCMAEAYARRGSIWKADPGCKRSRSLIHSAIWGGASHG